MKRREFVQSLAALTAWQALPGAALATTQADWALGFAGVEADLPPLAMTLEGRIPAACKGTLYRNGPALYQRDNQRYRHWFDPDGMVQAFTLSETDISHRGRFVRTRRFNREAEAGRFLYDGAGTHFEHTLAVRNNDDTNVANINIQALNGDLLALWEGGSAYRIDPQTLDTRGTVQWSEELRGVPFSAHPRFDENGALWNIGAVGFGARPMLVLYEIGANGKLRKSRVQALDFAGYMHDFVLTQRYLVVLNSSAVLGRGETFVDRLAWQPQQASQLLIFDRNDFSLRGKIDVPATFVFHFGNGWDKDDQLVFTACQYPNADFVKTGMARLAMQQPGPYHHAPELVRYSLSLSRLKADIQNLGVALEFPGFDARSPFSPQPIIGVSGQGHSPSSLASAVVRIDPRNGQQQRFDYGDGIIVEEPLLINAPEGDYIIHSLLDYKRRRSGLAILSAQRLAEGPLAMAFMDRVLPLGFHGCFLGQSSG